MSSDKGTEWAREGAVHRSPGFPPRQAYQSCSKELMAKFSKPKMSSRWMTASSGVSSAAAALVAAALVAAALVVPARAMLIWPTIHWNPSA